MINGDKLIKNILKIAGITLAIWIAFILLSSILYMSINLMLHIFNLK